MLYCFLVGAVSRSMDVLHDTAHESMARMQYSSPSRQSLLTLAWLARQMFYRWLVKSRVLGHSFICGSDPIHPGLLQLACPIRCVPASLLVLCPGRWMFYMAMVISPWFECSISSPSRQSLLTLAWLARQMFYKLLVKSRVLGHGFLCGSDTIHPGLLQLACLIRCVPDSLLVLCPGRWMSHMTLLMSPWPEFSIPVRAARAF
jgi:hypothetical protein